MYVVSNKLLGARILHCTVSMYFHVKSEKNWAMYKICYDLLCHKGFKMLHSYLYLIFGQKCDMTRLVMLTV